MLSAVSQLLGQGVLLLPHLGARASCRQQRKDLVCRGLLRLSLVLSTRHGSGTRCRPVRYRTKVVEHRLDLRERHSVRLEVGGELSPLAEHHCVLAVSPKLGEQRGSFFTCVTGVLSVQEPGGLAVRGDVVENP